MGYAQSSTGDTATVTKWTYDDNGNTKLVQVYDGYDTTGTLRSTTTNTWDIEGRLIRVATTDATSTTTSDFAYDDNGDRVKQRTGGVTTSYLNDASDAYDRALEEYSGGMLAATYVRGLDLLFQDRTGNDGGSTGRSFYAVDGLGSTRALVNSAGAVTDTATYDAYGTTIAQTTKNSSGVGTSNTYWYAGQGLDETGLYYNRARYYDAAAGRFTSRDSYYGDVSDPRHLSKYVYSASDPVNHLDESGHDFSLISTLGVSTISVGLNAFTQNALLPAYNAVATAISAFSSWSEVTISAANGVGTPLAVFLWSGIVPGGGDLRGLLPFVGATLFQDAQVRKWYTTNIGKLGPGDGAQRSAIKIQARRVTSPVGSAVAEYIRPIKDEATRVGGTANKSNKAISAFYQRASKVAPVLMVVDAAVSVYNIASSSNPGLQAAGEVGRWSGALAGGYAAAKAGALIGTYLGGPGGGLIGALAGGVIGSIYGSGWGQQAGRGLYNMSL